MLKNFKISYQDTSHFSKLVIDYINKKPELESFVNHFPNLDSFKKQIKEKNNHIINRDNLVEVLKEQNSHISLSYLTQKNIELLKKQNTFTVTTGHQLCLFTGPLYFIYKIISTINLSEKLKDEYPEYNFIPFFWLASEDHDFKEINHIHLYGKKIEYPLVQNSGPVGRMFLDMFKIIKEQLEPILGHNENGKKLLDIFERGYLDHPNLADATRFIVNKLFGSYGLVIINSDDKKLKAQFAKYIKKDILRSGFVNSIKEDSDVLDHYYHQQAFSREINFFRISDNDRVLITEKEKNIEEEIDKFPERFSPNVLLRPIFQEIILPNIATIGGASEIAYWLQLKSSFKQENIPFPILVLRNSVMLVLEKQMNDIKKLDFDLQDMFKKESELQREYILKFKSNIVSLDKEKRDIKSIYSNILNKSDKNGSLDDNIKAQLHKQLKGLDAIESKLIRFEKQKNKNAINKITKLKKQLFPNDVLQERVDNFIPFYLEYGEKFLEILKSNLDPLDPNFVVLHT